MEDWQRMTELERARVVDLLPCEFEVSEECMPEGNTHRATVIETEEVMRVHSRENNRRMFIGGNMPVYYPDENMFSPDVIVVLDVDDHRRNSWIVASEGKGLDMCIEIAFLGWKAKDTTRNVIRYAELGIREYFVFDMQKSVLKGYRLHGTQGLYAPLLPKNGRLWSEVLDLELALDGELIRFFDGGNAVLFTDERTARANAVAEQATRAAKASLERERAALERERVALERAEAEAARARATEEEKRMALERAEAEAARARAAEEERRMALGRAEAEAARARAAEEERRVALGRAQTAEQELADALAVIDKLKKNLQRS
jgi:Uma2 family endonuclease